MINAINDAQRYVTFKTNETSRTIPHRVPFTSRMEGNRSKFFISLKGNVSINFQGDSDDWRYEDLRIRIPIANASKKVIKEATRLIGDSVPGDVRELLSTIRFYMWIENWSASVALSGIRDCGRSRDVGFYVDTARLERDHYFSVRAVEDTGPGRRRIDYINLLCTIGAKDSNARFFNLSFNLDMLVIPHSFIVGR